MTISRTPIASASGSATDAPGSSTGSVTAPGSSSISTTARIPTVPVLGLVFEDRPEKVHVATVRVAPWFSNLLPEGMLRDWIASERGVNRKREIELLAQVGHDLPGAVRVLPGRRAPGRIHVGRRAGHVRHRDPTTSTTPASGSPWPGSTMKFSMLLRHERLTIPGLRRGRRLDRQDAGPRVP